VNWAAMAEDIAIAYGSPLVVAAVLAIPFWRMLGRVGLNPYWTVLLVAPVIGVVMVLAILAFGPWPLVEGRATIARRPARGRPARATALPAPARPWGEPPRPAPNAAAPQPSAPQPARATGVPRHSWRRAGTVVRRRRD